MDGFTPLWRGFKKHFAARVGLVRSQGFTVISTYFLLWNLLIKSQIVTVLFPEIRSTTRAAFVSVLDVMGRAVRSSTCTSVLPF